FTQPTMYKLIDQKPSVRDVYAHKLVSAGILTKEEVDDIAEKRKQALATALAEAREGDYLKPPEAFGGFWTAFKGGRDKDVPKVDTSVPEEKLIEYFEKLARIPESFHVHPKVSKVLQDRLAAAKDGPGLDWGGGEHAAFASLLAQGVDVRL